MTPIENTRGKEAWTLNVQRQVREASQAIGVYCRDARPDQENEVRKFVQIPMRHNRLKVLIVTTDETQNDIEECPVDDFEQEEQVLFSFAVNSSHITIKNEDYDGQDNYKWIYLHLLFFITFKLIIANTCLYSLFEKGCESSQKCRDCS